MYGHVYQHACMDMCTDLCIDMRLDMYIDMCIAMGGWVVWTILVDPLCIGDVLSKALYSYD